MLDENKHIDSLFADGLKGMSVEPNPEVWNAISGKMQAKRKKKLLVIYIATGIAAAILLMFTIANRALFLDSSNSVQFEQISENSHEGIESKQAFSDEFDKGYQLSKNEEFANRTLADKSVVEKPASISKLQVDGRKEAPNKTFNKVSALESLPMVFNGVFNNKKLIPKRLNYQLAESKNAVLHLADELQIKANLMLMNQQIKEDLQRNRWSLIGQLSSAYSNEKSGEGISSGIVSIGGGVKVNYALNTKLSFQSGLIYNKYGQEYGSSNGQMAFSDANTIDGEYALDGRGNLNFLPSNTSAGNITYKNLPKDALLDNIVASSSFSSENLMQSFQSIEVPFLVRYDFTQKRIGLFVTGGLGANFLVGNGVYQQSGSRQKIGNIENLRSINYSSQIGFGLEYKLNSKLQIGVEPSFKYYLNSMNKSNQFNYKPYSIGLYSGIRYHF